MKKRQYPLSQLADIKKRRLEEAEKVLKEKRDALDLAEKELITRRKALNASQTLKLEIIEKHYAETKEGTTSNIIDRHDKYIQEVINVKLNEEKKKVDEQKKVVKAAKADLEEARADRLKKHQALEKMHIHEKEWTKDMKKEVAIEEASVADELGTSMHARKMKKGKQ